MQSPETEDRWYVDVGGTPKMMTLDQLVEAFEGGVINAKTLVTEVGGSEWKPLKEVADLGDDEEEAVAAAPSPVLAPPLAAARPSPHAQPVRATLSAWPPVVASAKPVASTAPSSSVPPGNSPSLLPSGTSPSLAPVSTAPMVQDLGLSLDADFKPRKSKAGYVAAAVVVLFVGGLFGVGRLTGGGEITRPIPVPAAAPVALNTATSTALTTPTSTPAPAAAPTPAPTAASDSTSSDKPSDSASNARLSDEVKEQLKTSDKSRTEKKKASKRSHGHTARSKNSSGSSGVFRNGGSADDPLNSKL
jgi:hypothetical protein